MNFSPLYETSLYIVGCCSRAQHGRRPPSHIVVQQSEQTFSDIQYIVRMCMAWETSIAISCERVYRIEVEWDLHVVLPLASNSRTMYDEEEEE